MKTYNMLQVLGPNGYCKCYVNGRRVRAARVDLIQVHARMGGSQDCFVTTKGKNDRWHHRHVCRTQFAV